MDGREYNNELDRMLRTLRAGVESVRIMAPEVTRLHLQYWQSLETHIPGPDQTPLCHRTGDEIKMIDPDQGNTQLNGMYSTERRHFCNECVWASIEEPIPSPLSMTRR